MHGTVSGGFLLERVSHLTLNATANNAQIDVFRHQLECTREPMRTRPNAGLKPSWEERQSPREAEAKRGNAATTLLARIARRTAVDSSVAAKAEFEHSHDTRHADWKRVRVVGPFTVLRLGPPHRNFRPPRAR